MLISYGRPVVVRRKGVRLGMGWVGLGQLFGGLGWAGSMKIDPRTTLIANTRRPSEQSKVPLSWNISTVLI